MNYIRRYELTPEDHRSPDGTAPRVHDREQAHHMARASHEIRTEIEHRRMKRLPLLSMLNSTGAREKEKRESIRLDILERTDHINELRHKADLTEDEASQHYRETHAPDAEKAA